MADDLAQEMTQTAATTNDSDTPDNQKEDTVKLEVYNKDQLDANDEKAHSLALLV